MAKIEGSQSLLELYRKAFLIRSVELRFLELFTQGKIAGTIHTCVGQEFSGLAVMQALDHGDLVFSNHRGHGHYIAKTGDVDGLVAELMGKRTGACGGRGGSQHLHKDGFYSNGVQGGIVPVAAGLALALRHKGLRNIVAVFLGDGTLGEGVVYETFNIASLWRLPLLFVLENNLYAQSTPQVQALAGGLLERAQAFGIETISAGTSDPASLVERAARAASVVRSQDRPVLLKIDTYRLKAHSKGDDDRDPAEIDSYAKKDPLTLFAVQDRSRAQEFTREADERTAKAVAKAEAAGDPQPSPAGPDSAGKPCRWNKTDLANGDQLVSLLRGSLRRNMAADERIILIGEDLVDPYGGAFKVTKGLSTEFPSRVLSTPLSEAAITGIGNGLALRDLRPVVEIMFGDFITLAADQLINHASKFRYMYNEQVRVPLIVRTPMGGRRGYGPTHSQCLEKHLLGLPDTTMLALHARFDPGEVYDEVFRVIDGPVIVIEDKLLYGARLSQPVPEGFTYEHTDGPFPTSRLRADSRADVTILCYGGMLPHAEAAAARLFDEHEVVAEVVCPLRLHPFDPRPLLDSVQATHRLLIVEEGAGTAAFGAEAAARLVELEPGCLKSLKRLSCGAHPVPSAASLEKDALPGAESIAQAVLEMTHGQ